MPELNDIFAMRTKPVEILNGDGEPLFKIWVSPDKFTRNVYADIQSATDEKDGFAIAEKIVLPLVTKWDLTMSGKPYAITAENVAGLGLPLVQAVVAAINGALDFLAQANAIPSGASDDGLSTAT